MVDYNEIEHEGQTYKIYNSFKPERLEGETYEEYKLRRKAIKSYIKSKKNNFIHVSTMLLPLMVDGQVMLDKNNKPLWTEKTKGVTYRKNEKETDHMDLVKHFDNIKDTLKQEEDGRQEDI